MIGEEKTILSERIIRHILEDVKSGVLKPGDKLPGEKQMLDIYKVSRGSVREALRTLQMMNVIDIHQGKGSFVSSLDIGSLIAHLDFVMELDKSAIYNLFEARQILEPEIAARAAQRATPEELEQLKELINEDYNVDIFLHEKIASLAGNPFLNRFISSIYHLGEISREQTSRVPGVVDKVHDQHVAIVEAIVSRDPEQAKKCMRDHLDFVITNYRRYSEGEGA